MPWNAPSESSERRRIEPKTTLPNHGCFSGARKGEFLISSDITQNQTLQIRFSTYPFIRGGCARFLEIVRRWNAVNNPTTIIDNRILVIPTQPLHVSSRRKIMPKPVSRLQDMHPQTENAKIPHKTILFIGPRREKRAFAPKAETGFRVALWLLTVFVFACGTSRQSQNSAVSADCSNVTCAAGEVCSLGVCHVGCSGGGWTMCSGQCMDTSVDDTNCGSLRHAMSERRGCTESQCQSAASRAQATPDR